VSGGNHCRAHSSESEDLGSVSKSEVVYECLSFKAEVSLGIEMRREKF
jgi:hypothetical protein